MDRMGIPPAPRYTAEHADGFGDVLFRELKDGDGPEPGEWVTRYRWIYRPTGNSGERRIAVVRPGGGAALVRKWNAADPETWVYGEF